MLVREFWKIPFLRLIIPVLAGIVCADYFNINYFIWFALFLLCVAFAFIYRPFFDHNISYHRRWIFGVIISIGLFNISAYITQKGNQFDHNIIDSELIIGTINVPPKINPNSIKSEFKILHYKKDNVWNNSNEKILISFEKDSLSSNLDYGNLILLKGNLKEISNAGNPSEFDYKKYLARKHIHFKSYQSAEQWTLLAKDKGNPVFAASYKLRKKLLDVYQVNGIKGEEFGLLAALTLGATDYLNDELIAAYSDSGAMHILSVSGLHVGIILLVLNYLLFFLAKSKSLRILRAILIIAAIWFFALLTGLSPSVNRASAMITFFILAGLSNKRPSPYNSIVASAFILLLIDPLIIFDVGFQLSYLAVISLIFFYTRIYGLYESKYWLVDKVWSLTVVSIAAQIGTTALSIFYFHQFPVYAILSNLLIVPLSSAVMILAIALLFTSFIAPLAKFIAVLLNYSVIFQNWITKSIDRLPFATIEPISLNSTETLLMHIAIVMIFIYIITKNKKILISVLAFFIIAFALRDFRYLNHKQTETFTVYNVARKSAFSVMGNNKLTLYADSAMYNNEKSINYLTSNILANDFITGLTTENLENNNLRNKKPVAEELLKHIVLMDRLKIIYLNKDFSQFKSDAKIKINYLILSKNVSADLDNISNLFQFDALIADASVPKWKQDVLKRDCQQMAIPFYNVSESGAFVYQIRK
jgi:competence protein ComEC